MTYRAIVAKLTARTAVHIGSGEGNDLTDALLRRDAKGQPFIPGTAIAGALRALLTRLAPRFGTVPCVMLAEDDNERKKSCSCIVCHLFGDVNPSDEEGSESSASRLLVLNAVPIGTSPRLLIRDGVGIDRVAGAAARAGSVKFDLEVLPDGAEFELRMELRNSSEEDERLLAAGLAEWEQGRMWLCARVARGLGAFDLTNLEYKTLPLDQPAQLLAFLKNDQPWLRATPQANWLAERIGQITLTSALGKPKAVSRCWFSLTGILQAQGPLLTNDTLTSGASGFDHAPLLAQWGDWQHPVLPGAGLRGVLRSHAERLARTLATHNVDSRGTFLQKCPACSPVESRPDAPLASCDALLKGKIPSDKIVECLACRLFGSTRRGSRLVVEDAPYYSADGRPPTLNILDFLAIDRFTGGGAEHLKFDALALWKPAFTLRLHLDNPEHWELGWLWLVLRDLTEGWLQVGFGAAKGFGRVRLERWIATFGSLLPEDMPDVAQLGLASSKSGIYTTVQVTEATPNWRTLAQQWIDAFHSQVQAFSRSEKLALTGDSYFGVIDTLYPVMRGGAQ
ncbi:MAG: RAMP superfamily CRISPR-associated protein [Thermodesulfobacteriota bacterium]